MKKPADLITCPNDPLRTLVLFRTTTRRTEHGIKTLSTNCPIDKREKSGMLTHFLREIFLFVENIESLLQCKEYHLRYESTNRGS